MQVELKDAVRLLSPRLAVLVTTVDESGQPNAAPYSFAGPLSFDPPLVFFASGKGKRSLENASSQKQFVLNVVSENFLKQAVACEKKLPPKERLLQAGISLAPSAKVTPPHAKEARAWLECEVSEVFTPKGSDHSLVIGRVVHAECASLKDGKPDLDSLGFVMHAMGSEFRLVGEKLFAERSK